MENQNLQQENLNPTLPVSPVVQTSPPVSNPEKPLGSTDPSAKTAKLPFLIIGIILFLLVAGSAAGFYVFKQQSLKTVIKPTPSTPTPTIDLTANWKTYTNTVRGYSVKYPITFNVIETPKSPTTMEDVSLQKNVQMGPGAQGSTTALSGIVISIGYFDTLDVSDANLRKTHGNQITIESTTLEGKHAIKILSESILDRYLYVTLTNGYLIIRTTDANRPADINIEKLKEYEPTEKVVRAEIDQILSTFKFTDSNNSPLTDNALNNIHFILPVGWRSEYKNSQLEIVSSDWDEKNPSIFSRSKTGIMITINNNYGILPKTRDEEYKRLNDEIVSQKTDHPVSNLTKLTMSGLTALSFDESWEGYIKTYYIWQDVNTWSISINGNSVDYYKKQLDEFMASITFSK